MQYEKQTILGVITRTLDERNNETITVNGNTKYNGTITCDPFVWEMDLSEKGFRKVI